MACMVCIFVPDGIVLLWCTAYNQYVRKGREGQCETGSSASGLRVLFVLSVFFFMGRVGGYRGRAPRYEPG